jgi:hypothetical protein
MSGFKRGDVAVLRHPAQYVTVLDCHAGGHHIAFHTGTGKTYVGTEELRPTVEPWDWRPESTRISDALHANRLGLVPDLTFFRLALAGEVGEVLNVVKKMMRDGHTPELQSALAGELADVRIYLHHVERMDGGEIGGDLPQPTHRTFPEMARDLFYYASFILDGDGRKVRLLCYVLRDFAHTIEVDLDAEVRVKLSELYSRWPETADPRSIGSVA